MRFCRRLVVVRSKSEAIAVRRNFVDGAMQEAEMPCTICGRSYAHEHVSRVGRQDSFSSTDDLN